MAICVDFRSQISAVMEVLANAAVAEICKVINEGYAVLRLEMSRTKKENESLKSKLKSIELLLSQDLDSGTDGSTATVNKAQSSEQIDFAVVRRTSPGCKGISALQDMSTTHSCMVAVIKEETIEENIRSHEQEDEHYGRDSTSKDRKSERTSSLTTSDYPHDVMTTGSSHPISDQETPLLVPNETTMCQNDSQYSPEIEAPPATSSQSRGIHSPDDSELTSSVGQSSSFNSTSSLNFIGWRPEISADAISLKPETDSCAWKEASSFDSNTAGYRAGMIGMGDCDPMSPLSFKTGEGTAVRPECPSLDFSALPDVSEMYNARMGKNHPALLRKEQQSLPAYEDTFVDFGSTSQLRLGDGSSSPDPTGPHQPGQMGRLFGCNLCGKQFPHLHQLKTHRRVHTGEKPYSCPQCGKRFSQSSHIKRHMTVHTGERPFGCALCGKRFSQSCSLKVHQRVHTNVRPFSCTVCGKSFSVLSNLVRHQTIHIRKKTNPGTFNI